jgi:hypothetical protein
MWNAESNSSFCILTSSFALLLHQLLNVVFFQEIHNTARIRDLQNKVWQGARLICMTFCFVFDLSIGKVNVYFIAFGDIRNCFGTFQYRQANIDCVAKKDPRKRRRNDALRL